MPLFAFRKGFVVEIVAEALSVVFSWCEQEKDHLPPLRLAVSITPPSAGAEASPSGSARRHLPAYSRRVRLRPRPQDNNSLATQYRPGLALRNTIRVVM